MKTKTVISFDNKDIIALRQSLSCLVRPRSLPLNPHSYFSAAAFTRYALLNSVVAISHKIKFINL